MSMIVGIGENVETAQEMAALDALKRLFLTDDAMKALPFGRQLKPLEEKMIQCEKQPNMSISDWTSDKFSHLVV